MKHNYFHKFCFLLAFTVILSTVAPVTIMAVDTVMITNSVTTSSDTGNKSGADGKTGEDGKAGQDGKSGTNGTSVISGASTATIHIASSMDGETVVDVYKTTEGDSSAVAVYETNVTTTQSDNQTEHVAVASDNTAFVAEEVNPFSRVLYSIHLILSKYVSFLFS